MKLSEIKGNPDNPRVIKDAQFEKLCKSIKDFPEMMAKRPMVCVTDSDGKIYPLGGNMRLKALQHLGYKEIQDNWVLMADEWTEEQRKEFVIKDNVASGEWDWDVLANEWDAVKLEEWGLELPDNWGATQKEAGDDDYEIPDEIKTDIVLGDLFEIGEHRLLCGDSTCSDTVAKLMNGEKADMVFTDPPWNVAYGKQAKHPPLKHREIANDDMSTEDFRGFMDSVFNCMYIASKAGSMVYVVMSAQEWGNMMLSLNASGFHWSSTIIWAKDSLVLSRKDYHTQYEPIWYGWNNAAARLRPLSDRTQSDLWEIQRPKRSDLHPTMKPIALCERAIKNSSIKNNVVLDIFTGSGSTMVAAHQLNRKCYGMELDPKYCQVIIDRMLKLDPSLTIKRNGEEYTRPNA
jgi:DNA modification methylase